MPPQLLTKLRKLSLRRKSKDEPVVDPTDAPQSPLRRKLSRKRWSLRRKSRAPTTDTQVAAEQVAHINHAIGEVSDKLAAILAEQQHESLMPTRDEFPPAYATDDPMDPSVATVLLSARQHYFTEDGGITTEEPLECEPLVDECQAVQALGDCAPVVAVIDQEPSDLGGVPFTDSREPPSTFDRQHVERLDAAISQLTRQVELLLLQNQQRILQNQAVPAYPPPPPSPPAYQLYSAGYEDVKVNRYNDARRAVLDYHTKLYPRPPELPTVSPESTLVELPAPAQTELENEDAELPFVEDSCSEYSQEGEGEECVEEEEKVEEVASPALTRDVQSDLYPVVLEQPEALETPEVHCAEEPTGSGRGLKAMCSKLWVLFMNWFVCQVLLLRIPFLYQPHPSPLPNEVITRSLAVAPHKTEWPQFISCRLLEWKTTCGFSAVILPSILTLLQVSDAATNALTRGAGLACFMLSLISLLSGGALLFRHREPKDPDSWSEHAEAFSERRSGLFASMALPVASAVWSLVCFLIAMMSFVWQPVPNESDPNVDDNPLSYGERIGLTVVCGMCFVGLGMAVLSFGRRGCKSRSMAVAVS